MTSRLRRVCTTRGRFLLLASLSIAVVSASASASDGVREIGAICAVQTGCFPGDAPGYPVTITQPGGYRLTSSLAQTAIPAVTTASTAIEISASNVDLDLNGFSIRCANPLGSCAGTADGIATVGSVESIAIRDGSIRGMPGAGINAASASVVSIENIHAQENAGTGIRGGFETIVQSSIASRNGGDGIVVDLSSLVMNNVATSNGGNQIASNRGTLVRDNTIRYGLSSGSLLLQSSSGYRDNIFWSGATGGAVSTGGENLGGNLCDGALCP